MQTEGVQEVVDNYWQRVARFRREDGDKTLGALFRSYDGCLISWSDRDYGRLVRRDSVRQDVLLFARTYEPRREDFDRALAPENVLRRDISEPRALEPASEDDLLELMCIEDKAAAAMLAIAEQDFANWLLERGYPQHDVDAIKRLAKSLVRV